MTTIISNPNKEDIKKLLEIYYSNYIIDNKEVLAHIADIDNPKITDNDFERISKTVLKLEFDKSKNFFVSNTDGLATSTNDYKNITELVIILKSITNVLYEILNKDIEIYSNIKNIYLYADDLPEKDKQGLTLNESYTELFKQHEDTNANSSDVASSQRNLYKISYNIDGGKLNIYNLQRKNTEGAAINNYIFRSDLKIIDVNNQIYKLDFINNNGEIIIKNFVYFLTSFKDYNSIQQLHAFHYYLKLLHHFIEFYYHIERLLLLGVAGKMCYYFNNLYATELKELKSYVDDIVKASGQQTSLFDVNVKCIGACPIVLELESNAVNYFNKNTSETFKGDLVIPSSIAFYEDYVIVYNNKTYEILTSNDEKTGVGSKKIKSITIKAVSNDVSCQNRASYPIINGINLNSSINIYIRKKTLTDLKKDYFIAGKELTNINIDLRRTKDKINTQVQKYEQQKNIVKNIDIRTKYIYCNIYLYFISISIKFFYRI